MSDDENDNQDQENGEGGDPVEEKPVIDYDEVDDTGFKKVEKIIWSAFKEWKNTPEDSRDPADEGEWMAKYVEQTGYDPNRVKTVMTLGVCGPANNRRERERESRDFLFGLLTFDPSIPPH